MADLDAAFPPAERTGPPGGRYANELFTAGAGAMTVYRPVREPRPAGRVEILELPAADVAVTVHAGPRDAIDVTYGRLATWVLEHAPGGRRPGRRDLPGRPGRHLGRRRLAHRNRLAGVPPDPRPLTDGVRTVIARIWRGVVATDAIAEYVRYVEETGVTQYRRTPGNRSAEVLTRDLGDGTTEILALTVWDGWDDIRRFAGDDVNTIVLYPQDERYLIGDSYLTHYDVSPQATDARAVAEAFSGHRFAEAYPFLAEDVAWNVMGGEDRRGREAVIAGCEATLAGLAGTTTEYTRFVAVGDAERAAVDTVARYTGPDGEVTVVASCDVYEFRDGLLTTITSYYAA